MKHLLISILMLILPTTAMAQNVILINPFEVPKGQEAEAIVYWEAARDFLQQQPGYVSTELHQSIQPNARFHLINIAEWENIETFKAATSKMRKELTQKRIEGMKFYPALYDIIRK
ncbi:antibiotic biosynthesis monooxygenase [Shewanella psychropiezotolerans]|uniref:Antibiotic biosynthesis monooxygenase n=1 Tax=Shewanella psychropiezotolerans TaxID=2593655 RepID=A0ABX5WZW5_9GAMM|nr:MULTISPECIES: antibiotic biosynthesis monooxygenase family protein [Shewanella]MPY21761.1 antibiotic biosynthesis monooxygenase [Shewanella sp. YLB-07]QDO84657.1 antibiotic biosynthesis monooxygenase [Shewanella psychropiezotolerans]